MMDIIAKVEELLQDIAKYDLVLTFLFRLGLWYHWEWERSLFQPKRTHLG